MLFHCNSGCTNAPRYYVYNYIGFLLNFQKKWARCDEKLYLSWCKYPLFLFHFNENWIFLADFQKFSNIKFHTNPSSWCQGVPLGRTGMRKLVVAFRNFAKAFKKGRKRSGWRKRKLEFYWNISSHFWLYPLRIFLLRVGDIFTLQQTDWFCTWNPITVHTVPYMKCVHQSRQSPRIAWNSNFDPISYPETSLCNYKHMPRNI